MPLVEVRLFGHLRRYLPTTESPSVQLDAVEGHTVEKLINDLGIPAEDPKVILVNGLHTDLDHPLQEGDRVSIFPPIAGG
jgi:molybdopterin synthase sulfur carrier subunit